MIYSTATVPTRGAFGLLRNGYDQHEVRPSETSPTSLFLPGADPLRTLVIGDGPAVGFQVTSHELALAGHVARELGSRTDRGVVVDIRADARMTPHDALDWIDRLDMDRYDAVVATLGTFDAMRHTPARAWVGGMHELVDHLSQVTRPGTPIALGSIPPLGTIRSTAPRARRGARSHSDMLNVALAGEPMPSTVATVALPARPPEDPFTPESHLARRRRWARDLVDGLGDLDAATPRIDSPSTRRAERRRQESLQRTGVLTRGPSVAFEEIVGTLQRTLSAPIAAVNFIDDSRLVTHSVRGVAATSGPRSEAFCDHTIRSSSTLVVPDMASDRRFENNRWVVGDPGLRWYAGHPIESPDGERIGSLCVMGDRPRHVSESDVAVLQQLAFRVQRELYATA